MSQELRTIRQQAPEGQRGSRGGWLRSFIQPFMPEVTAGINAVDAALSGDPSAALGQASKLLAAEDSGEPPPPEEPPPEEGPKPPPGEEQKLAFDFTPPQIEAFNELLKIAPGVDSELQQDPSLLDGASNMVNLLKQYYSERSA